jgi:hypothetical protein
VEDSLFITKRSGDATLLNQIAEEESSDYGQVFKPKWPSGDYGSIEWVQSLKAQREGRGLRVFSVEGVRIGQE